MIGSKPRLRSTHLRSTFMWWVLSAGMLLYARVTCGVGLGERKVSRWIFVKTIKQSPRPDSMRKVLSPDKCIFRGLGHPSFPLTDSSLPVPLHHSFFASLPNRSDRPMKCYFPTMRKSPSLDIRTLRRQVEGLGATIHLQGGQWILCGRKTEPLGYSIRTRTRCARICIGPSQRQTSRIAAGIAAKISWISS